MPRGWRIVKSTRVDKAFDGEGARLYGGRWNSPGTAVVYTSQSESLAALELLVHLQSSHLLGSYSSIPVDFAGAVVETLDQEALPPDWRSSPAPSSLQEIGDRWASAKRSVVLRVPSAVVPREDNFLFNPEHPEFSLLTIGNPEPFPFDSRLK